MKNKISYIKSEQRNITNMVTEKFKKYYLTGGTALSFYFDHRFSEDLDFFTQKYKKEDPDRIMGFVSKETRFSFRLEAEQDTPGLVPMKVYYLELKRKCVLKIDFIQDFRENIKRIKNGMHSLEDIYFRKIVAAMGVEERKNAVGRVIAAGRQTAKDFFDVYYLSSHYKPVADFFLEYISITKAERFIAWHRKFNRLELKMDLLDLVPGIDTNKVLWHLDDEILKRLPDKLILGGDKR